MKINKTVRNYVMLGWSIGAASYLGYSLKLDRKTPTPINEKILENTAVADKSNNIHYNLKTRQQHLQEVEEIIEKQKQQQQQNQNQNQQQQLQQKNDISQYDLIVIGGGASGSGVVLDAASRGMKCLLLEQADFAAATSSKSTKLIHGGVRYLQQVFEFSLAGGRKQKYDLVKEALKERTLFLENGFYMNKAVPIIIPSNSLFWTMYYYLGTVVYHLVYVATADKNSSFKFKFPVIFGKNQMSQNFPYLDDQFKYGVVFEDGQMNDTRMNIDVLLTSTLENYVPGMVGSNILNYAKVTNIIKNSETEKVEGVEFEDTITGKKYQVKSRAVCNCAGNFSDQIRKMDNPDCGKKLLNVGGSHIVLGQKFGSKKYGMIFPETPDGRIIFSLPWQGELVVGTTEQSFDEPELNPKVSFDEMLYLVQEFQKINPKLQVQEISNGIQSKWCGLRPLILKNEYKEGEKIDTKSIARTHVIEVSKNNLFSLMGGKWTVYRKMGEETVDSICDYLKKEQGVTFNKSEDGTKFLRLSGVFTKQKEFNFPKRRDYIKFFDKIMQEKYNFLEPVQSKHLIRTYGDRSFDIMKICKENMKLRERVHPQHPFIKAEIVYHIRQEMAIKPIDVIYRRTRLGFIDRSAIMESLPGIVDIFAQEQKWDEQTKQKVFQESQQLVQEYQF